MNSLNAPPRSGAPLDIVLKLSYPEGSVTESKELVLTEIGSQGLQGKLPFGWSPLVVFDLRVKDGSLGYESLLMIPNT